MNQQLPPPLEPNRPEQPPPVDYAAKTHTLVAFIVMLIVVGLIALVGSTLADYF